MLSAKAVGRLVLTLTIFALAQAGSIHPVFAATTGGPSTPPAGTGLDKARADSDAAAADATKPITDRCKVSTGQCKTAFDHYTRADNQTNVSGTLSLFGWAKVSDQTFAGYAQELYYTEVDLGGVEYQVGYGYIITARQQDAKPSAAGAISGVELTGSADLGYTRFTASVIGLAPDQSGCPPATPTPAQTLLCGLEPDPTVSQDYFKNTVNRLSAALNAWSSAPSVDAVSGRIPMCPQIINFRSVADHKKIDLDWRQKYDEEAIQKHLLGACQTSLPNAHVTYQNGKPGKSGNLSLGVEGGAASASQTAITQGYYRNRNYLAVAGGEYNRFYDPTDQYGEVFIVGLNNAASLPSVFAAIITLNASVNNQRTYVKTQCSGGASAIDIAALEPTMPTPVTVATGFDKFFSHLRNAADTLGGGCAAP